MSTDDLRGEDPDVVNLAAPCSSCAACERELSAVRLELVSALGQAQEHEAENQRLRDALAEIIEEPRSTVTGRDVGCLDLHEARTIARDALSATTRKETP
jgi:hypothetical protein